jgi:hypothetical protein
LSLFLFYSCFCLLKEVSVAYFCFLIIPKQSFAVSTVVYWKYFKFREFTNTYDWNIADFFPVRTEKNVTKLHVFLSFSCNFPMTTTTMLFSFVLSKGWAGRLTAHRLAHPPPLCIPMHLAKLEDFARERWIMLCPVGRLVSTISSKVSTSMKLRTFYSCMYRYVLPLMSV